MHHRCTPRHAWLSLAHTAPAALELFATLRDAEPDLATLAERLCATFDGDRLAFADLAPERLAPRLPDAIGARMRSSAVQRAVEAALERCVRLPRHHLLTPADAAYPERIATIDDAPPMLALSGDLACLDAPAIAIVGARRASRRGLDAAGELACGLAEAGFSVVSGLAIGIDAAAHRGALSGQGRTLAVMATGADRLYPERHARLAGSICERGALLTEFPLGHRLEKDHFPIRNRLVSALAYGVVLIEAAARSGTLTTATHARRQNRDVMVLPGSAGDPAYRGGHELLEEGAVPVTTAWQVLECVLPAVQLELTAATSDRSAATLVRADVSAAATSATTPARLVTPPDQATAQPMPYPAGSDAARALGVLDHDPVSLDGLSLALPIGTARLLSALSLLEAFALARRDDAGRYSRCLSSQVGASTLPFRPASGTSGATDSGNAVERGVDDAHHFELD